MEELKEILKTLQELLKEAEKIRESTDIKRALKEIKLNSQEERNKTTEILLKIRDTISRIYRAIGPIRDEAIKRRIEIEKLL